jgi:hypothetical protein
MTPPARCSMNHVIAAVAAGIACMAQAAAPLTERCNTTNSDQVYLTFPDAASLERVRARIESSAPEVVSGLWSPLEMVSTYSGSFFFSIVLRYPYAQDLQHIAASIEENPILKQLGLQGASVNGFSCMPLLPRAALTVTEYHNAQLDHYFLSSSAEENRHIDSGAAGGGWSRTGETFVTYNDVCDDETVVYRFYGEPGIGPNSHFFTRDGAECGALRRAQYAGWLLEGRAFRASPLRGTGCAIGKRPVYRLYNNRAAWNDANHRYVVKESLYASMQERGWIGEGPVFCVPNV